MSSILDVNLKTAFLCFPCAVLPRCGKESRDTDSRRVYGGHDVFPIAGASDAVAKSGVRHMSAHIRCRGRYSRSIRSICINPGEERD